MSYTIVEYDPAHRHGVLALLRHLTGGTNASHAAYLDWKYGEVADTLLMLALHDGRVVGMRGYVPGRWRHGAGEAPFRAVGAGDFVVEPAHRGRGLFRPLNQMAVETLRERGHHFALAFSASPVTYLHSVRAGWIDIGPLDTWRRELGGAARARAGVAKVKSRPKLAAIARRVMLAAEDVGPLADLVANRRLRGVGKLDGSAPAGTSGTRLTVSRTPRPEVMATLAAHEDRRPCPETEARLGHVRDAAWYAWRYRTPRSRYRFVTWEDSRPRGFLVLETPLRLGHRPVRLLDFAAEDDEILGGMLKAVTAHAGFPDLRLWTATLPAPVLTRLQSHGFAPHGPPANPSARYRHALLGLDLRPKEARTELEGADPLTLENWALRMAFSDK